MSQNKLIELVTAKYSSKTPPKFRVGDTVNVHIKIVEGGKHRVQAFNGVVIACRGRGTGETFTVRRIVGKEGVERLLRGFWVGGGCYQSCRIHAPCIHQISADINTIAD